MVSGGRAAGEKWRTRTVCFGIPTILTLEMSMNVPSNYFNCCLKNYFVYYFHLCF